MLEQAELSFCKINKGKRIKALTPNSVANFGEIDPAMTWQSWVPALLNWYTLYDDNSTGERCNENGDNQAAPDKPYLDLIPHNSKKKCADSQFTHPDERNSRHLAEQFILDSFEIYDLITDVGTQAPQAIIARNADEDRVKDMESLWHVSSLIGSVTIPLLLSPAPNSIDSHQRPRLSRCAVACRALALQKQQIRRLPSTGLHCTWALYLRSTHSWRK